MQALGVIQREEGREEDKSGKGRRVQSRDGRKRGKRRRRNRKKVVRRRKGGVGERRKTHSCVM